jgi:hypothetical protein
MNGRRNEELNSGGRRADSDHLVVSGGVRLDQPHLVAFIPAADLDVVWHPDLDSVQRADSGDPLSTGDFFHIPDQ